MYIKALRPTKYFFWIIFADVRIPNQTILISLFDWWWSMTQYIHTCIFVFGTIIFPDPCWADFRLGLFPRTSPDRNLLLSPLLILFHVYSWTCAWSGVKEWIVCTCRYALKKRERERPGCAWYRRLTEGLTLSVYSESLRWRFSRLLNFELNSCFVWWLHDGRVLKLD